MNIVVRLCVVNEDKMINIFSCNEDITNILCFFIHTNIVSGFLAYFRHFLSNAFQIVSHSI